VDAESDEPAEVLADSTTPAGRSRYILGATDKTLRAADLQARIDDVGYFAQELMGRLGLVFNDPIEARDALLEDILQKNPCFRTAHIHYRLRDALLHHLDGIIAAAGHDQQKEEKLLSFKAGLKPNLGTGLYAAGPITVQDGDQKPSAVESEHLRAVRIDERNRILLAAPGTKDPPADAFLMNVNGERVRFPKPPHVESLPLSGTGPGAPGDLVTGVAIETPKVQRKRLRDEYKAECKAKGVTVTDEMIAEAASPRWKSRANIQKWLSCDPKYDGEPDRLIREVFRKRHHLPKST